jgi:hypothetical protein
MANRAIYLATAGEYSDYRVVGAFVHREHAEAYGRGDDVSEIELGELKKRNPIR